MDEIRKKQKISDGIRSSKKIVKERLVPIPRAFNDVRSIRKPNQTTERGKPVSVPKRNEPEKEEVIFSAAKKTRRVNVSLFMRTLIFFRDNKKTLKWFLYILIYFGIIFFFLNKNEHTKVVITPKKQQISESKVLSLFSEPNSEQLGFDIIAISDELEKSIKAEGKKPISKKAQGTITVYNNYSTEPQKLSPETRFESLSGKIFKLDSNGATIPGKKDEEPGSIELTVYAQHPGSDYNIDITDFTIPGFKESGLLEKFNTIDAVSLKPCTGGIIGEESVVNEEQKKNAVNEMESDLKKNLVEKLEAQKTEKVILVDKSIQVVFKEPILSDEKEGEITIKQEAQIFAVVIEKKQLEEYLTKVYLPDVQTQDVTLSDFKDISFSYEQMNVINFKNLKKIDTLMKFTNSFVWEINTEKITQGIAGQSKFTIKRVLDDFEEVEKADIKIYPFWKKEITKDIENITIIKKLSS